MRGGDTIITERATQILVKIINSHSPISIGELSEKLKVSSRTIRYDLDNIDEFLRGSNLPGLIRKPNSGIGYSDSFEERDKCLRSLQKLNNYSYSLSKEERVNIILSELLKAKNFVTIDSIAEKLYVSRSTIQADLAAVRKWVENYELNLISAPRHGIRIEGNEKQLRRATVELLIETVETDEVLDIIRPPVNRKGGSIVHNQVMNLFKDIDIAYLEKCVKSIEEDLQTFLSDEAYSNLIIHIAIAIKRIQLGKDILMPESELKSLAITKEFIVASKVSQKLEEHFKVSIPADEVGYITIHLLGSSVSRITENEKENWVDLQLMTNALINNVESRMNLSLLGDNQLFQGIMEHLRPALYRVKHGLTINNPLLKEIMSSYKELFNKVKESLKYIEEYCKHPFNDHEVGYLTMHFGAAIERLKNINIYKPNILIVCGTGIGTAKLLMTRLQAVFDVNVIGTVSYHQAERILRDNSVDLVVSTVPIQIEGITCVEVNAMLTSDDIDKLRRHMKTLGSSGRELDKLIGIIKKHCAIIDHDELVQDLSGFLNMTESNFGGGDVQPMLKDILKIDDIKLNVEAGNWEEAVRAGGGVLEERGCIEHRYVDAMVETVKQLGAYIVIAPGIAMPHARPESGVKKIGISLITLKNSVSFGNPDNDPVKIVVSLCAIDHSTHLRALSDLVEFLGDENFISTVLNAQNNEEIIRLIN